MGASGWPRGGLPGAFVCYCLLKETAVDIVSAVMELYGRIDRSVAEFQLKSGLRCSAGCGACCPAADVQVTILEMLPLAHEIICRREAAVWLERLASPEAGRRCLLYCADPGQEAAGHCRFYNWRPALCRLFGFAAVKCRDGSKALSVCKHIKRTDPAGAEAALRLAEHAPCFVHYSSRLYGLDPALGNELMPINTALRRAIDRIGLYLSFAYRETLRDNSAA